MAGAERRRRAHDAAPALTPVLRRRLLAGAVAVVAMAGIGTASAARLQVVGTSLAAGSSQVTSCQGAAEIAADLVSTWTSAGFRTTAVVLAGVNGDCGGETYRLSLVSADGQQLAEVAAEVPAGGGSFTSPSFTGVPTSDVVRVEVVIHS